MPARMVFRVLFKQRTLFIEPCGRDRETRTLKQHIEVDTKETYCDVNLKIEGNINAGGAVTCSDLSIAGNVLGKADASGNINIKGNAGENESFIDRLNYRTIIIFRRKYKHIKKYRPGQGRGIKEYYRTQFQCVFKRASCHGNN